MKRKSILFVLALILVAPCMFILSACGSGNQTKGTQTSNLVIENVYQNSYGSVYIEFENADQYMDVENNEGTISYDEPTIEISCDNGTTWTDYSFCDYENLNLGIILNFHYLNNNYINVNNTYSIGHEINIIARLKENNNYYASNSTAIYNYTLKSVIPDKHFSSCNIETEGDLIGQLDRSAYAIIEGSENIYYDDRFEFVNNNNEINTVDYVLYLYNDVIKMGTVTISGDSYTITPYTNYGNFEYRFYKEDGTSILMEITNSYDTYNYDSDGWTSITSTGITFNSNNTYEMFDVTFLNVLIRQKETSENCFSLCYSKLFEIITD